MVISTFHRLVDKDVYPADWRQAMNMRLNMKIDIRRNALRLLTPYGSLAGRTARQVYQPIKQQGVGRVSAV